MHFVVATSSWENTRQWMSLEPTTAFYSSSLKGTNQRIKMLTLTQKSHCLTTSLLYLVSFYHDISVSINVATRSLYLDSYPENSLWGKNVHGLFIFPQVQTTVNDWHLWWYKAFFFRRGLPKAPNQAPGCSTQSVGCSMSLCILVPALPGSLTCSS